MGSSIFLLHILQVIVYLVHHSVSQPPLIAYKCNDTNGNYTNDSQYGKNLQAVLFKITSNTQIDYGFYNFSVGQKTADRVYGIALCRGDATVADCRTCVDFAKTKLIQQCPVQKEAIGYNSDCLLRYSDRSIFRTMELTYSYSTHVDINPPKIAAYKFKRQMLLEQLKKQAAAGGSRRKFAVGEVNITTSFKLYAAMQCTPDLSQSKCTTCLEAIISEIPSCCKGHLGVTIKKPSCVFEMENYLFYHSQQSTSAKTPPIDDSKSKTGKRNKMHKINWIFIVLASTFFLLFVGAAYCTSRRSRQIKKKLKKDSQASYFDSIKLDFNTVKAATDDFSDTKRLHEGAPMYKGVLPGGQEIVVKRLSKSCTDTEQYLKNEASILANLQQRNLVKFLGSCFGEDQSLLIYEFLPNKSLDQFLYDPIRRMCLDWETRRKIIVGIARGLVYLHEDSHLRVIHCNLKASNILLGTDMNPKISNFKMARLIDTDQTERDNKSNMNALYKPPEHVRRHGRLSIESDVFSFGVLLLEIICGQKIRDFAIKENEDFLSFAWRKWSEGTVSDIVDQAMPGIQCHTDPIMRYIQVGLLCLQENVTCRPTMSSVLFMLNSSMIVIAEPLHPGAPMLKGMESVMPSIDDKLQMNVSNEISITLLEPR